MWKELTDRLSATEGKALQKELLDDVNFILDNFGQPVQYYNGTNPESEKINAAIDRLVLTHSVIFAEDKEDVVKKLYHACSGKEINGNDYKRFYANLGYSLYNIWHHGEKTDLCNASMGSYTTLKKRLFDIRQLLETGERPDIGKIQVKYSKEMGKQPEEHYHQ